MQKHFDEKPQGLIWNTFSHVFFFFPLFASSFSRALFLMRRYLQQETLPHTYILFTTNARHRAHILSFCCCFTLLRFSLCRKTEMSKSTTSPMWSKRARRRPTPPSLSCSRFWDRAPLERWCHTHILFRNALLSSWATIIFFFLLLFLGVPCAKGDSSWC